MTVSVWWQRPREQEFLWSILDDEERGKAARFRFHADRVAYVSAHALVRQRLSAVCTEIEPRQWRWTTGLHGRPEVRSAAGLPTIQFNLSRRRDLVAVAILDNDVDSNLGVDIETRRPCAPLEVASHYFSAEEHCALNALPEPERHARFYVYWTLKEAYIKALGVGLSLPLDSFTFDLGVGAPRLRDDRGRWRFASFELGGDHQAALAVRTNGRPLKWHAAEV